jgi:cytochrome P450
MPAALQTLGTWRRPTAFLDRARARYGSRFTLRLLGQVPFVMLSDPEEIKQLFMTPPDVVHPGQGARILEPIVGANSVILLDGDAHLEQRKLMLPAFHGERMERLGDLMRELTEQEIDRWPREQPIELHSRLQRLTLEIILRAVFGLEQGARLDALRDVLTEVLAFSESPLSLLPTPRGVFALLGPARRFNQLMARTDGLIFELIAQQREEAAGQDADGDDVLAMLLAARHQDGSPMSAQELRDELMTALVAGHETTASQLAWAFERLAREPEVLSKLLHELDEGESEEYLTAVIYEILRHKPVLPFAQVAVVKQPVEIGGVHYQPGVALVATAHLLHHDPAIYPEPRAFRPERFIERPPSTYTWIPFGGGRRRCLGASFAQLEMKIVLRAVLERCALRPADWRTEPPRRRSITISPGRGSQVILRERLEALPAKTPAAREALVA